MYRFFLTLSVITLVIQLVARNYPTDAIAEDEHNYNGNSHCEDGQECDGCVIGYYLVPIDDQGNAQRICSAVSGGSAPDGQQPFSSCVESELVDVTCTTTDSQGTVTCNDVSYVYCVDENNDPVQSSECANCICGDDQPNLGFEPVAEGTAACTTE